MNSGCGSTKDGKDSSDGGGSRDGRGGGAGDDVDDESDDDDDGALGGDDELELDAADIMDTLDAQVGLSYVGRAPREIIRCHMMSCAVTLDAQVGLWSVVRRERDHMMMSYDAMCCLDMMDTLDAQVGLSYVGRAPRERSYDDVI